MIGLIEKTNACVPHPRGPALKSSDDHFDEYQIQNPWSKIQVMISLWSDFTRLAGRWKGLSHLLSPTSRSTATFISLVKEGGRERRGPVRLGLKPFTAALAFSADEDHVWVQRSLLVCVTLWQQSSTFRRRGVLWPFRELRAFSCGLEESLHSPAMYHIPSNCKRLIHNLNNLLDARSNLIYDQR